MKILTIAIPAYNMELCLARCLDSVVKYPEIMDMLDVIVVNDGSGDGTSALAHRYADRYPDTVTVIDKSNGHYGSAVNVALQLARGKYFRVLDADDCFDADALRRVIGALSYLRADCVFTNYAMHDVVSDKIDLHKVDEMYYDKTHSLDTLTLPEDVFAMHALTYKTSLLRAIGYKQTEGVNYSDIEYVYYPLVKARSIYFLNETLYLYTIGREGQSMTLESQYQNRYDFITIDHRLLDTPLDDACNMGAYKIRERVIVHQMLYVFRNFLLYDWPSDDDNSAVSIILQKVKYDSNEVYGRIMSYKRMGIPIFKIWRANKSLYHILSWLIRLRRKFLKR